MTLVFLFFKFGTFVAVAEFHHLKGLLTMKRLRQQWLSTALSACAALSLTACDKDYTDFVSNYAAERIPLKVNLKSTTSVVTAEGGTNFYQVRYFKRTQRVCDTVVCGSTWENVCHTRRVCENRWNLGLNAMRGGRDNDNNRGGGRDNDNNRGGGRDNDNNRGGGRDNDNNRGGGSGGRDNDNNRGGGRDNDNNRGGGRDNDNNRGGGWGHDDDSWNRPREYCRNVEDCSVESVPQYCEQNCRDVEIEDSDSTYVYSRVSVVLEGVPQVDASKIEGVSIGVDTNDAFKGVVMYPAYRPEKAGSAFDGLKTTDKTFVVLQARGYKLVEATQWVPETFKVGDPIVIRLKVASVGGKKTLFSSVGTEKGFPAKRQEVR